VAGNAALLRCRTFLGCNEFKRNGVIQTSKSCRLSNVWVELRAYSIFPLQYGNLFESS